MYSLHIINFVVLFIHTYSSPWRIFKSFDPFPRRRRDDISFKFNLSLQALILYDPIYIMNRIERGGDANIDPYRIGKLTKALY